MLKQALNEVQGISAITALAAVVGIKAAMLEIGDDPSPAVDEFISSALGYAEDFIGEIASGPLQIFQN